MTAKAKCMRCGTPLDKPGLCKNCYEELKINIEKIKEYMKDAPAKRRDLISISKATGIDKHDIWLLTKTGHLDIETKHKPVENGLKHCKRCGAPITRGYYCEKCRNEIFPVVQQLKQKLLLGDKTKAISEKNTKPFKGFYNQDSVKKEQKIKKKKTVMYAAEKHGKKTRK